MSQSIPEARNGTFLINLNVKFTAFEYVYVAALVLFILCVFLCVVSCVFGLVSWILIEKWRRIQNYVFVNVFLVCAITMTCYFVVSNVYPKTTAHSFVIVFFFVLSRVVMCHWLLVATIMFYMEIVKVFNNNLRRRYLLVNLYGWLVPITEVTILFVVAIPLKINSYSVECFTCGVLVISLVITGVIYLRVLYTLINLAVRSMRCKKDVCHKIILCTVACVTSGISTFMPVVVAEIVYKDDYVVINSICIVSLLHIIAIVLFFLGLKSHRELWAEYWRRRSVAHGLVDDIVL